MDDEHGLIAMEMDGETAQTPGDDRRATSCCRSWSRTCASTGPSCARNGRDRIQRAAPAGRDDAAGDRRRDHLGLRQLRRGARDRKRRGPAALRPRPVRADHPARCGDRTRSSASCCCCATCSRGPCSRSTTDDFPLLNRILDAYEPAANRIANTVAVSFVEERERVIRQQQDAIRELSTPVLPVRERLLILPIIGVLDSERARQLTEQLLAGIRTHRAKVVVIDITGAPTSTRPSPTTSSRPSTRHVSWARASSSPGCPRRSPRPSSRSAST